MPIAQPVPPRLKFTYPPRGWLLVAAVLVYLLFGSLGHDPWKGDDAVHIGVAKSMLDSGDWLVPHLAGELFTDFPPLYFWIAKLTAILLGWLMPLHDAIRMASVLFAIMTFGCLAAAARALAGSAKNKGDASGPIAVMIAIGTLGFLAPFHEAQPLLAVLATQALAMLGLVRVLETPWRGGTVFGAGVGLAHLSGGFSGALMVAPLALLLPALSPAWRERRILSALSAGLLLGIGMIGLHCALLQSLDPGTFATWLDQELADLQPKAGMHALLAKVAVTLPWFAWPALPIAAWALWCERHDLRSPAVALPLSAFVVALVAIAIAGNSRNAALLPLAPPLILLATGHATTMRRGLANAFDWFGMMSMSFFMALIWIGYIAMATGWPSRLARQAVRIEPGFVLQFSALDVALGIAITLAWLILIFSGTRSSCRGTVHWAAGICAFWALAMTLWVQWVDYGRSYRPVSKSLAAAIDKRTGCIAGRDLGDSQRASFYYFDGIVTQREIKRNSLPCPMLLVQQNGRRAEESPGASWRKLWEGRRRGDRNEMYRLYVRD